MPLEPLPRTTSTDAVAADIAGVVGAAHVRAAAAEDAVAGVRPRLVAEPGSAAELARVLRLAAAAGLAVAPRGGGTKTAWGNPPRAAELVLSTRRLDALLEHAAGDLTVTVEAGCTIAGLQQAVAGAGQRLALDPATPERATVGGVIATNDGGSLRGAWGSLRDQLIGIHVALPDGRLARSGGKVVKNVAGYDLPKLFCGSLGTLGVVVEATFRLYPLPRETRTLRFAPADIPASVTQMRAILASTLRPTGVQLTLGSGAAPELAVRLESGSRAALDAQQAQLCALAAPLCAASGAGAADDPWLARERLHGGGGPVAVCKVTFLPGRLASLIEAVAAAALPGGWRLVAQAAGIGWLRLEATSPDALRAAILHVRHEAVLRGGSLVLAESPADLAPAIDVWGDPGDALPLMRRIKERFDPENVLNPGRFVGGI
jgi:glycolate oxidase FAD binding subunit